MEKTIHLTEFRDYSFLLYYLIGKQKYLLFFLENKQKYLSALFLLSVLLDSIFTGGCFYSK